MKLIPFEEVVKILKSRLHYFDWEEIRREIMYEICSIQSIDPIAIIDEMIDELLPDSSFWTSIINSHKIDALQELKSRLTNIDTN